MCNSFNKKQQRGRDRRRLSRNKRAQASMRDRKMSRLLAWANKIRAALKESRS
jgi:hypothetical protein